MGQPPRASALGLGGHGLVAVEDSREGGGGHDLPHAQGEHQHRTPAPPLPHQLPPPPSDRCQPNPPEVPRVGAALFGLAIAVTAGRKRSLPRPNQHLRSKPTSVLSYPRCYSTPRRAAGPPPTRCYARGLDCPRHEGHARWRGIASKTGTRHRPQHPVHPVGWTASTHFDAHCQETISLLSQSGPKVDIV